jgi:hypothetical protein
MFVPHPLRVSAANATSILVLNKELRMSDSLRLEEEVIKVVDSLQARSRILRRTAERQREYDDLGTPLFPTDVDLPLAPNATLEELVELALHPHFFVRIGVLHHPNTPGRVRIALQSWADEQLRRLGGAR